MSIKIELLISKANGEKEQVAFDGNRMENSVDTAIFQITCSRNGINVFSDTLNLQDNEILGLVMADRARSFIDSFDPELTQIEIIQDPHGLLRKSTYSCPQCHRKLFESWGKAKGIATKCSRCRKVCVPVLRE